MTRRSEPDPEPGEGSLVFGNALMYFKLSPPPFTRVALYVLRSGAVLPVELRRLRDELNALLQEIELRRGA